MCLIMCSLTTEQAQDKQIQKDEEFYDGDFDNDHDIEDAG